jgi:hypothetical protein
VTWLVRSGEPRDHDIDGLRSRVAELEAALGEREAEVGRLKADLAAFRARYRQDVGLLHEELEELEQAIADAELGELSRLLDDAERPATASAGARPETAPRLTSDAVRRLFRDVARTIHPDLAGDEGARDRRHALMIEANRAYALGDEDACAGFSRRGSEARRPCRAAMPTRCGCGSNGGSHSSRSSSISTRRISRR